MSSITPFSVIIPAAGNSGRMGFNKALLSLGNGKTFLENLLSKYREYKADPIIIVINNTFDLTRIDTGSSVCIVNEHVSYGRYHSIKLGLQHIPLAHGCFIQNVDNPFVDLHLLDKLVRAQKEDSYIIPVHDGRGGHPVLLGKDIVRFIHENKKIDDFREVLSRFSRIEVPWNDPMILLNINTPDDYNRFSEKN